MKISHEDFNVLILCAFRYSLGRMTYISSTCVSLILKYWEDIGGRSKCQMKEEIQEAIRTGGAGMECDIKEWEKLLDQDKTKENL